MPAAHDTAGHDDAGRAVATGGDTFGVGAGAGLPATDRGSGSYGPVQACARLGLARWQFDRALAAGLIPAASGRWPASVVEDAAVRLAEIVGAVGSVPDVGAVRAGEELSVRLGVEVSADAVAELHRTGRLPAVGEFKGHRLYCGRALETLAQAPDAGEVVARAERDGALHGPDQAAARLGIRRADLRHLTAAGLLTPTTWGRSVWTRRRRGPDVPLYRAGDLDALAAHPGIDWAGVRATPPGWPSPLRDLTTGGADLVQALAAGSHRAARQVHALVRAGWHVGGLRAGAYVRLLPPTTLPWPGAGTVLIPLDPAAPDHDELWAGAQAVIQTVGTGARHRNPAAVRGRTHENDQAARTNNNDDQGDES